MTSGESVVVRKVPVSGHVDLISEFCTPVLGPGAERLLWLTLGVSISSSLLRLPAKPPGTFPRAKL